MTHVTFSQVSKNYYNVFINGKAVSLIRYPSTNPYLKHLTLPELAKHEADRILKA